MSCGEERERPGFTPGDDLVLTGHDHEYDRRAPLDAVGRVDREKGIRSFWEGVERLIQDSTVSNQSAKSGTMTSSVF